MAQGSEWDDRGAEKIVGTQVEDIRWRTFDHFVYMLSAIKRDYPGLHVEANVHNLKGIPLKRHVFRCIDHHRSAVCSPMQKKKHLMLNVHFSCFPRRLSDFKLTGRLWMSLVSPAPGSHGGLWTS